MTAFLNNHIARVVLVTAALLLIPLIAMQFNEQVNWTGEDFVIAGALLLMAGFALDVILRKVRDKNRKIIALGVLAAVFLYVWAELAVGVFTNLGS
jgi:hypothetical protein